MASYPYSEEHRDAFCPCCSFRTTDLKVTWRHGAKSTSPLHGRLFQTSCTIINKCDAQESNPDQLSWPYQHKRNNAHAWGGGRFLQFITYILQLFYCNFMKFVFLQFLSRPLSDSHSKLHSQQHNNIAAVLQFLSRPLSDSHSKLHSQQRNKVALTITACRFSSQRLGILYKLQIARKLGVSKWRSCKLLNHVRW